MTQRFKTGKEILQVSYTKKTSLPTLSQQDIDEISDWDWVINAVADPTYGTNAVELIKLKFFNDVDDNFGTILANLLNRVHGLFSPEDLKNIFTDTNVTTFTGDITK